MSTAPRPAVTPQAVVGVSICLMGIALTLDNLGLYKLRTFWDLWPILPISIGALTLMYAEGRQDWVKGTIWLAVGTFFLFGRPISDLRQVLPLGLVALGAYLVWRARTAAAAPRVRRTAPPGEWEHWHEGAPIGGDPRAYPQPDPIEATTIPPASPPSSNPAAGAPPFTPPPLPNDVQASGGAPWSGPWGGPGTPPTSHFSPGGRPSTTDTGTAGDAWRHRRRERERGRCRTGPVYSGPSQRPSLFALMSGVRRQVTGAFAGAEATAIMGGVELDLRHAAMLGDEVNIDTFALWGGIEIWVPANWQVVMQGLPLMGGFEDKTHVIGGSDPQPRLVVRGIALMGGVEIKN
jgi:LiaF transmembrane domain